MFWFTVYGLCVQSVELWFLSCSNVLREKWSLCLFLWFTMFFWVQSMESILVIVDGRHAWHVFQDAAIFSRLLSYWVILNWCLFNMALYYISIDANFMLPVIITCLICFILQSHNRSQIPYSIVCYTFAENFNLIAASSTPGQPPLPELPVPVRTMRRRGGIFIFIDSRSFLDGLLIIVIYFCNNMEIHIAPLVVQFA